MPADAGNLRSLSPAALDDGMHHLEGMTGTSIDLGFLGSTKRDKKYRQYASNVERALALFDSTLQEWADYISFLGRLLKVRYLRT